MEAALAHAASNRLGRREACSWLLLMLVRGVELMVLPLSVLLADSSKESCRNVCPGMESQSGVVVGSERDEARFGQAWRKGFQALR